MASSEQYGFVFAVSFIVIFSVLVATIPVGLQGQAETPDMLTPLDPNIISGFSDSADYQKDNFTDMVAYLHYSYNDLGGRDWVIVNYPSLGFVLAAKIVYGGFLWLGQLDSVKFTSTEGTDREDSLTFAEIEADAEDGVVRYNLQYYASGASAGGFVVYWNETTYSDPSDAWDNDELYLLHGVGIEDTARADIAGLLISLLFLQIPDIPLLLNVLLVTPVWACIVFVLWFVIKETIPFV